jgi:hypothetical protein
MCKIGLFNEPAQSSAHHPKVNYLLGIGLAQSCAGEPPLGVLTSGSTRANTPFTISNLIGD